MIHWNAMPCRINGKDYPSQIRAAYDLGVLPSAISQAIRCGREDRVATGAGRRGNKNAGRRVELFGMSWLSRKDAAAAFGMRRQTFAKLLDAGTPEAMDALRDALLSLSLKRDAERTAAALKHAEMIDRFGKRAA